MEAYGCTCVKGRPVEHSTISVKVLDYHCNSPSSFFDINQLKFILILLSVRELLQAPLQGFFKKKTFIAFFLKDYLAFILKI